MHVYFYLTISWSIFKKTLYGCYAMGGHPNIRFPYSLP